MDETRTAPHSAATRPEEALPDDAFELVGAGCRAIWNFAPTHIRAPGNILIKNENMASSLALISHHLRRNLEEEA